jgi:hypothetical protein
MTLIMLGADMTPQSRDLINRTLISGTISGITTALTASATAKHDTGRYPAALNATSHIVWGDRAALQNDASLKYTATGFLLNHASTLFWATIYEKWFAPQPGRRQSALQPIVGAAVLTAGAYVTDYYLVPKRFTPGYEKRVSGRSLATIYAALALGLAARALFSPRR